MHEPAAASSASSADSFAAFARWSNTVDTFCSAIAGFALLAGARAFAFTALLAWREPVLGGAGLVLLAALGWLRWQWRDLRPVERRTLDGREPVCVACYNRPLESESNRDSNGESNFEGAVIARRIPETCRTARLNPLARRPFCMTRTTRPHPAVSRQPHFKERSC